MGVNPGIVHRKVIRAVDILHFKGEPTAVSGGVGEEVSVVAGSAKAGYVVAVFLVMCVCGALVDYLHGGKRLYLVHLLRFHFVQFLQAHNGKFGKGEEVVFGDAAGVGLQIEVTAQFG